MFERFDDRARKVMALARKEAQRLSHDSMASEHLFLGLLRGGGVVPFVLRDFGIRLGALRIDIDKRLEPGRALVTRGQTPFTPQAKNVLERTLTEAQTLRQPFIGPEHILLAMLSEETGDAVVGALKAHGVDPGRLRRRTIEVCTDPDLRSRAELLPGPGVSAVSGIWGALTAGPARIEGASRRSLQALGVLLGFCAGLLFQATFVGEGGVYTLLPVVSAIVVGLLGRCAGRRIDRSFERRQEQ